MHRKRIFSSWWRKTLKYVLEEYRGDDSYHWKSIYMVIYSNFCTTETVPKTIQFIFSGENKDEETLDNCC